MAFSCVYLWKCPVLFLQGHQSLVSIPPQRSMTTPYLDYISKTSLNKVAFIGTRISTWTYLLKDTLQLTRGWFAKLNWIGLFSTKELFSCKGGQPSQWWDVKVPTENCLVHVGVSVCVSMFALCVCSLWPAIMWNSTLRDEFLGQSPKRLSIKLYCRSHWMSIHQTEGHWGGGKYDRKHRELAGVECCLVIQAWKGLG